MHRNNIHLVKYLVKHDAVLWIAQDLFKSQSPQPQRAIQVRALLSQLTLFGLTLPLGLSAISQSVW